MLGDRELQPLSQEVGLPPETGESFAENAIVKARTAAAHIDREPRLWDRPSDHAPVFVELEPRA